MRGQWPSQLHTVAFAQMLSVYGFVTPMVGMRESRPAKFIVVRPNLNPLTA